MDYLAELRCHGFRQADDHADSEGRVEFNADLFRGTANEVTVQVYAIDQEELEREIMPTLEAVLPQVAAMVDALGEIDADLAQVILYRGRLGLHVWSRGVNNEFTAVYAHIKGRWIFQRFGEIFGEARQA
jgi:fumarate hydratase class II